MNPLSKITTSLPKVEWSLRFTPQNPLLLIDIYHSVFYSLTQADPGEEKSWNLSLSIGRLGLNIGFVTRKPYARIFPFKNRQK